MNSLFIIGNGFDCYGHYLHTKYADFREYLVKKYPDYEETFYGILESTMMPDGDELYDMNQVVGNIIRLMDECAGDDWCYLESCMFITFYIFYKK